MRTKKVSVIIPYARRIENIKYCLRSLNDQTLGMSEYEVVIGCLEYSTELLDFLKAETPLLDIVLVMSNEPWNTSRARNIAIKEAVGEVLVFVDADMIIPKKYIELHYLTHHNSTIPLFILGQTRDYDEGLDVSEFKHHPFEFYANNFLCKNIDEINLPKDIRWTIDIFIDWAMGWTFNLSLTNKLLKNNNLHFDENFKGWGVEDIEWAYRIKLCGAKVLFSEDIWAIHLSHVRNVNSNHNTESINFKKMLCKWPAFDVEIVTSFGDIKGNLAFPKISESISYLTTIKYPNVCTIEFRNESDETALFLGGCMNSNRKDANLSDIDDELKENWTFTRVLPLIGFSLPYEDNSIKKIYYSQNFGKIDNSLKNKIYQEVDRLHIKLNVNESVSLYSN
jgi:glycosyltransferase involved in cell wall biosynthesis